MGEIEIPLTQIAVPEGLIEGGMYSIFSREGSSSIVNTSNHRAMYVTLEEHEGLDAGSWLAFGQVTGDYYFGKIRSDNLLLRIRIPLRRCAIKKSHDIFDTVHTEEWKVDILKRGENLPLTGNFLTKMKEILDRKIEGTQYDAQYHRFRDSMLLQGIDSEPENSLGNPGAERAANFLQYRGIHPRIFLMRYALERL
jgi:hypothetical protein